MLLRIDSPDNKVIKLATSLKQRKYRELNGLFVVEGKRSVLEVLRKKDLVETLLIDEKFDDDDLAPRLYSDTKAYIVKSELLKRTSTTENPQGIMALVKKPVWNWQNDLISRRLILLVDRVADPGNLGNMLRLCWGLAVDAVLLTPGCVDVFSPKVVRSTMGAIINVPIFNDVSHQQLISLQNHGFNFICSDVNTGISYYDASYLQPSIIVMGNEAQGVDSNITALCSQVVNIPLKSGVDSLNVAAACAIILAEAWRQRSGVPG